VESKLATRSLAIALALGALAPAAAVAATTQGSATYAPSSEYPSSLLPTSDSPSAPAPTGSEDSGGAGYDPNLKAAPNEKPAQPGRPVLELFQVARSSVYAFGKPATISFRVSDRSRYVRVTLAFIRNKDKRTHRVRLGRQRTGVTHTYRWRGNDQRRFARQGEYHVRLNVRDPDGNKLVRSSQGLAGSPLKFATHRFPVAGPYDFGGPDARFGTDRPGHKHQGQDILAAEGTPVVAPRGGLITWRAYQKDGAGYYLVLAGEDEAYNYVFMHLQRGSILVSQGDQVKTGQRLASVGSTGAASATHLHFEIWDGPWFNGGKPIDPLPFLRSWASAP
jgi:murein DD-endopeptidase MepM/ murein hydrolase activator NlpD